MQSKGKQKGIGFEMSQRFGEWLFEFRVGSRKLDDTPIEMASRQRTYIRHRDPIRRSTSAPSHGALALLSHLSMTGGFVKCTTCVNDRITRGTDLQP